MIYEYVDIDAKVFQFPLYSARINIVKTYQHPLFEFITIKTWSFCKYCEEKHSHFEYKHINSKTIFRLYLCLWYAKSALKSQRKARGYMGVKLLPEGHYTFLHSFFLENGLPCKTDNYSKNSFICER